MLITTDEESTSDDAVVALSVDGQGTEDELAGSLKSGEETTNEVGAHEDLSELLWVSEGNSPQAVLASWVVLPEPWEGTGAGILVGVLALPVIQDEGWAAEKLQWVLGWLLLLDWLLNWLRGLWSWLLNLWSSWLWLLLWWSVLDSLGNELWLSCNSLEGWEVGDESVPTGEVGVLGAEVSTEDELVTTAGDGGNEEIGSGDSLTNQEGLGQKVGIQDADELLNISLSGIDVLLVVGILSDEWAEPGTELWQQSGVGEGHPLEDQGVVLLGLAQEGGLLVLGSDCKVFLSDSVDSGEVCQGFLQKTVMAMVSERVNPLAPTKVGTCPRGLISRYSGLTSAPTVVLTISRSTVGSKQVSKTEQTK